MTLWTPDSTCAWIQQMSGWFTTDMSSSQKVSVVLWYAECGASIGGSMLQVYIWKEIETTRECSRLQQSGSHSNTMYMICESMQQVLQPEHRKSQLSLSFLTIHFKDSCSLWISLNALEGTDKSRVWYCSRTFRTCFGCCLWLECKYFYSCTRYAVLCMMQSVCV